MENTTFLPLGSIIIVKGGVKKAMIIARGVGTEKEGAMTYFDYGACLYPEGLVGDEMLFINHSDIAKVVFEGYSDEDNELMTANIREWLGRVSG